MAIVPFSVVPTVAPDARPPSDYQTEQASPASFGSIGAQELEQSGQNLKQAGAQGLDAAVSIQEVHNKAAIQDATNQALDVGNSLLYDPQNGYLATQNRDAMDKYQPTLDSVKQRFQDIRDTLSNPMQKLGFDADARRYLFYYEREMGSHADQQSKLWYNMNDADTQKTSVATSATSYNNPDIIAANMDRGYHSIAQSAARNNWGPDITAEKMREFESNTALEMMKTQSLTDKPGAAKFYNEGTLPGLMTPDGTRGPPISVKDIINGSGKQQEAAPILEAAKNETLEGIVHRNIYSSVVPQPTGEGPRGIRNNNPLNLEFAQGQGAVGSDGRFGVYPTMEAGVAASAKQLLAYQDQRGLNTVSGIVGRWSPASDPANPSGSTPNYVASVSKAMGVGPNDTLNLHNPVQLAHLISAMATVENGRPIDPQVVSRGIGSALDGSPLPSAGAMPNVGATWKGIPAVEGTPFDNPAVGAPPTSPTASLGAPNVPGLQPVPPGTQPISYAPAATGGSAPASAAANTAGLHNPAAFGMESQMLDNIRQEALQRFPGDEAAAAKAVEAGWRELQIKNALQQKTESDIVKQKHDAVESFTGASVTSILTTKDYDLDAMIKNPIIADNPQAQKALWELSMAKSRETGQEPTHSAGYAKAWRGMFPSDGSTPTIQTNADLIKLAGPDVDPSVQITPKELPFLLGAFDHSRKSLDEASINVMANHFQQDAMKRLLFSGATPSDIDLPGALRDTVGEHIFNTIFVPQFQKGLAEAKAMESTKPGSINTYLSEPNVSKMVDGLRNQRDKDKAYMAAMAQLSPTAPEAPGTPLPQPPMITDAVKDFPLKEAPGMVEPGNLDPWNRPVIHNKDGSYSTTSSMSIGTDKGEVLIPTVVNGMRLSPEYAKRHFSETGENFGTFSTPEQADDYATKLHNAQASLYDEQGRPKATVNPDEWSYLMKNVPTSTDGKVYNHAAWSRVLTRLVNNPDEAHIYDFNEKFGSQLNLNGEDILKALHEQPQGDGLLTRIVTRIPLAP